MKQLEACGGHRAAGSGQDPGVMSQMVGSLKSGIRKFFSGFHLSTLDSKLQAKSSKLYMSSRELGVYGEAAAERYLLSRGYQILARGWRVRGGEIDLIAEHGGEVVFVEVKTRYPGEHGDPEEAVTAAKRAHLRRAVFAWLDAQPVRHRNYRIDVIALSVDPDGGRTRLRHIMNAVGERS